MDAEPRRAFGRATWISLAAAAAGGILLLLETCFGNNETPPSPPAETRLLSSPAALAPFFASLAALDAKTVRQPVRVLQIGDSHTANDSFSGRMRERLQERFGNAGRGWLPAGIPFKYYRPHFVSVGESGWRHVKPNDHANLPLGLDAIVAESQPPDASMSIDSAEPAGFDHIAVEFLSQPNGSAFTVTVDDGAPIRVSTAAGAPAIQRFDLPLDHAAHRVELRAADRPPVVLLGWSVERQGPGIVYENHGTIGATIGLLNQMTPQTVSFELGADRPALLVVAFGTNEGFDDGLELDRYAARFRENVAALRHAANGAPVLILGPPDGNRVGHGCTAARCQSDASADTAPDDCVWHEPAKLAAVRDIQRRTAAQEGWAYWSWFEAMGGRCSIDRMSTANPPLAMSDHVHLSSPGYQAMADQLFDELMRDYQRWKAQPRTS